jgi:small subunit ribosomal protein S16
MLVIRFQRIGRKNVPAYRLVCAEKRASAKGKVKEFLGHYLPGRDPHVFEFKRDRVEHWIKQGAAPSDSAARLLTREGVPRLEKFVVAYTKKKRKKQEEEKPKPVADVRKEAPKEQPKEFPQEEAKATPPVEAPQEEKEGDREEKTE